VTVFVDGNQSRSNSFVCDAVKGTLLAIAGARVGEIYNIGGGAPLTLNDAIDAIARSLGVTPIVRHDVPRPGDQRTTMADTTKARAAFGYTPVVGPADGLPVQVSWHLSGGPRPHRGAARSLARPHPS
jgi:nucleoside-diphosphate-sugar epimerase